MRRGVPSPAVSPPGRPRSRWHYRARQAAWAAADLVYPPVCAGCGSAGQRLCGDCQAAIHILGLDVCSGCGYPLYGSGHCGSGMHTLPAALAGVRSAAYFEGPLQQAIHRLKYRRDIILADSLAQTLAQAWRAYGLPAGHVVPVPLSVERQSERGYNQSALLGQALAELAGLAYEPRALERVRHTDSQVGLSGTERRQNVRGAFQARPERAAGRAIVLVDDICTTGATLSACAMALGAAGAAHVWGLTLGRAAAYHGP